MTIAVRYLSRREYSRRELRNKLLTKAFTIEDVDNVLNDLEQKDYLSDERFADMFLRSQINKGNGPFKIKMALNQKGVADAVIAKLFDNTDINWLLRADQVRRKHFGQQLPTDHKGMAKQIRYLRNKGFYQQHIDAVFSDREEDL